MIKEPTDPNRLPIHELLGGDLLISTEISGPYAASSKKGATILVSVEATLSGSRHTMTTRFHICFIRDDDQTSNVTIIPAELEDELDGSTEKMKSLALRYSQDTNKLDNHTFIANLVSDELLGKIEVLC